MSLINDLRVLGRRAPLRAFYEIGRRSGIVGSYLRYAAHRWKKAPPIQLIEPRWAPALSDADWIKVADPIVAGKLTIFGREITIKPKTDWHADEVGGTWPRISWWKINLYSNPKRDVKHVWEIGRHRHLVVLARAAAEGDVASYNALKDHIEGWIEQNPPEIGIHWYSNLEISLRALAWIEILWLVGTNLPERLQKQMARHLYHSGTHIIAGLPYTISSARNNHLIGDAVGLMAIGAVFPSNRRAKRWGRIGAQLLTRHLPDHIAHDGSSIEDSLGYRAFVAELLSAAAYIDPEIEGSQLALRRIAGHLRRLGVGTSVVPRFGDWDGGSAIADKPTSGSPFSALKAIERILGTKIDENPIEDGSDAGGGYGRTVQGPWVVYLKAGTGPSHGHADLLSVCIAHEGNWIVGDPANGSYNRSEEWRDYFRTSSSHDVLRIEGLDQREPHRRFRWKHNPKVQLGDPFDMDDYRVMWGFHSAYERLDHPVSVMRTCLISPDSVIIADWTEPGPQRWELSLPLHPDIGLNSVKGFEGRYAITTVRGENCGLSLPDSRGSAERSHDVTIGWWADDYDVVRPTTVLAISGKGNPIVWSLWRNKAPQLTVCNGEIQTTEWSLTADRASDGTLTPSVKKL